MPISRPHRVKLFQNPAHETFLRQPIVVYAVISLLAGSSPMVGIKVNVDLRQQIAHLKDALKSLWTPKIFASVDREEPSWTLLALLFLPAPLHGFAFWFDVEFNGPAIFTGSQPQYADPSSTGSDQRKKRAKSDEALILSTAPEDAPTHWQQVRPWQPPIALILVINPPFRPLISPRPVAFQTLIYFYDPIEVQQDQIIEGSVTISQSRENSRFLNVHLEYA